MTVVSLLLLSDKNQLSIMSPWRGLDLNQN